MKHLKYFESESDLRGIEAITRGPQYLRRINKLKNKKSIVLNLEDCLTELFDDYSIPEQKGPINISGDLSWWSNYDSVTIEQINYNMFNDIKQEILRLQPIIEDRVYNKITISDGGYDEGSNKWINIRLRKKIKK